MVLGVPWDEYRAGLDWQGKDSGKVVVDEM